MFSCAATAQRNHRAPSGRPLLVMLRRVRKQRRLAAVRVRECGEPITSIVADSRNLLPGSTPGSVVLPGSLYIYLPELNLGGNVTIVTYKILCFRFLHPHRSSQIFQNPVPSYCSTRNNSMHALGSKVSLSRDHIEAG